MVVVWKENGGAQMVVCDREMCMGCGACVAVCPVNGIALYEDGAVVEKCVECGRCLIVCPVGAMKKEGA